MLILRPYQQQFINSIRTEMSKGVKHIICQAPTGSGKTLVFTYIAKSAFDKGNSILILTNRGELLEQAGGSFDKINLPHSWLTTDVKEVPTDRVIIAMVETLNRRCRATIFSEWVMSFDIVIVDEAHISSFNKFYQYISPSTILLGFTATPYRTGNMVPLHDHYDTIVVSEDIASLIDQKFLSEPEYYGISVDLSGVKKIGGEFSEHDLEERYTKTKTFASIEVNYSRLIQGRKSIVFCPTIKTAEFVRDQLLTFATESIFLVHGELSQSAREEQLENFADSYPAIIINVGILTTGYDCPDIDTVILYRATTSLPLYLQMIGRGSRTTPTKTTFRILDFGQNVQRHNFWHSHRSWSLDIIKANKGEGVAPIKDCPKCNALITTSSMVCVKCGFVFPVKKPKKTDNEIMLERIETLPTAIIKRVFYLEQTRIAKSLSLGWIVRQMKTMSELKAYGQMKGYSNFWPYKAIKLYKFKL